MLLQESFTEQLSKRLQDALAQKDIPVRTPEPAVDVNAVLLAAMNRQAQVSPAPATARPAAVPSMEMLRQFMQFQDLMSPANQNI